MTFAADLQAAQIPEFRRALLGWYDAHRRDLPWRGTRDPYRIWVSEIMLQQTRVAAALLHYEKFVSRFPNVSRLAAARQSSVLAAWSGLGYYRRARNLHAAAKQLVRDSSGVFPDSAEDWEKLPGIGRYTAAAIASIAFNEATAVLDGNVERVLRRLLGEPLNARGAIRQLWNSAQQLLDRARPGDFNQAMMELGATVCLPSQPLCTTCPVAEFCRTRGRGSTLRRNPPQRKRRIAYALSRRTDSVFLVRRDPGETLMPGMWELPQVGAGAEGGNRLFTLRHSITITDFTVDVFQPAKKAAKGSWVRVSRLNAIPLTGLTRKILRKAQIIH